MNTIIENMKQRRTTRHFTEQAVEREKIDQIIEAGLWAPSGGNKQPWHFTVVQDRILMNRLSAASKEAAMKSDNEYIRNMGKNEKLDIFYGGSTMVLVSSFEDALTPVMDISAATQNMLLAAESLELGTCWNGMIATLFMNMPEHEVIAELNLPEGAKPSHAVVIGYKGHEGKPPARKEGVVQYL